MCTLVVAKRSNDIRKESAENSDESIMANRRRLKNQNMPSAPNETANEESSNSAIMSQWKSKPSTTKILISQFLETLHRDM